MSTVKARREAKEKIFTLMEWRNMPKHKYGWQEIADVPTPPEATEVIENNKGATANVPTPIENDGKVLDFDKMNIQELQNFAQVNNLEIENYLSLTKTKLLKAIKKLVQNG